MKLKETRSLHRISPALTALVAGLTLWGCSQQPTATSANQAVISAAPSTSLDASVAPDDGGVPPSDGGTPTGPNVIAVNATMLTSSPTGPNNALITAQLDPSDPTQGSFDVNPDENDPTRVVTLHDDGLNGDAVAGDHIFSAIDTFDFNLLVNDRNQQIAALQQANQQAVQPIFQGRELVDQKVIPQLSPAQPGSPILIDPVGFAPNIQSPISGISPPFPIINRSLTITDPSVVNDPTRTYNRCTKTGTPLGQWTFGHVMQQMANTPLTGITGSQFVMNWLTQWNANQTINGWNVQNRQTTMNSLIINPWLAASGGSTLDLSLAPFRLVAIVNRLDLRSNPTYGGSGGSGGETRLVFALEDSSCNARNPPFLVIFEFGNLGTSCQAVKAWGTQWANLSTLPFPSATYNTALAAITETVVKSNANPRKPNGSAINQVRTNEFALSAPLGLPWELREFRLLHATPSFLTGDTVKLTPDISLNNTPAIPFCMAGCAGGSAPEPACWRGPNLVPNSARFNFGSNTCNGCHTNETGTNFTMVSQTGALSGFLTGITVPDCAVGAGTQHSFNDLRRRQLDLNHLTHSQCFQFLRFPFAVGFVE